jgi:hypothetical protein
MGANIFLGSRSEVTSWKIFHFQMWPFKIDEFERVLYNDNSKVISWATLDSLKLVHIGKEYMTEGRAVTTVERGLLKILKMIVFQEFRKSQRTPPGPLMIPLI